MSLPKQIKSTGTAQIRWGCSDDAQYGIVQGENKNPEGQWREAKNHLGQTVAVQLYDQSETHRVTILLGVGKTPPELGAIVRWDGKQYVCQGADETARNEEWVQLELTLKAWQGIEPATGG